MVYALHPHLQRFGQWIGHWRGPGRMADSREVMVQASFTPLHGGMCLEVLSAAFDSMTGECINSGLGYWVPDERGAVVASIISHGTGTLSMREIPDDPAGVCIEGIMSGGQRFTVALVMDGRTLTLTSRRKEGYEGVSRPITFGVMYRIGSPVVEG